MNKLKIIQAMATKNECHITGLKVQHVGILVHSTGANNPNLQRYCDNPAELGVNPNNNHWNQFRPGGQQICAHAFIGYDINNKVRVCQTLTYEQNCWLSGKGANGSANFAPNSRIQFEICEDNLANKAYFDEAVMNVSTQYCAELCQQFGWNPLGRDSFGRFIILDHASGNKAGIASNHGDITHWLQKFGKTMDDYRQAVKVKLDVLNGDDSKTDTSPAPVISAPQPAPIEPTATAYKVVSGDTMTRIANRFGVPLSALTAANPQIKDINKINVGQIVNIPSVATPIPPSSNTTPTKKTVDEVAWEIWRGQCGWGNNPERKQKLIAYGGEKFASDVQARVNQIANTGK